MATATVVETVEISQQATLKHICREHPRAMDPPCVPGCVGFCGAEVPFGAPIAYEGSWDLAEVCMVCEAMS